MGKKSSHHIIFDLDGTLINSKPEILRTYRSVFSSIIPAVPPDFNVINFGATINEVLKSIYGTETDKIREAKKMFASIYDHSDYTETILYEGVEEILNYLKRKGNSLYIATNKRYSPTVRILEKKNIADFFLAVMANEMQPDKTLLKEEMIADLKERYSFSEGYMVGDSMTDIVAGKNQNLKTIAVTYGYENRDIFADQNPTYIVDSFHELKSLI